MARYTETLRDQNLRAIPGALVSVTSQDGTTATLTDDNDQALDNPFPTDAYGTYTFNTAAGLYTLTFTYGGRMVFKETVTVGTLIANLSADPDNAGKYLVLDADGVPTYSTGTGADAGLRTDLAASGGAGLAGFLQPGASAVARTVQDKLAERYSVKDYRQSGDANWGVTIQRAIDATSARGGGTVEIPAGTYTLPAVLTPDASGICCLVMKTGVTLVGASRHGTILKVADNQLGQGSFFRAIVSFGLIENVGLSNFTFDGNRAGQGIWAAQGNGGNIVLGRVSGCVIDNIVSKNANGQGIQVMAPVGELSARVTIRNCEVSNTAGSTLNADGSVNLLYNGNGIGIQISQCELFSITDNVVFGCHDNAIDTFEDDGSDTPTGGRSIITGNNLTDCRVGIFPETTSTMLVANNYITDMAEGGIFINRIYGAPAAILVCNNLIGNLPIGVRVSGDCQPVIGVQITENMIWSITDNAGAGIQLGLAGANVSYVDVSRNIFGVNNANASLIMVQGAQAAFISGYDNHYFGAPTAGKFVSNTATVSVDVNVRSFIGISDVSRADMARRWAAITKLEVTGTAGFFGATAVGRQTLGAAATDAATTMALANNIRTALINLGLGGA